MVIRRNRLDMNDNSWQSCQSPQLDIPPGLRPWLLHAGSFMERLRAHGVDDLKVQVMQLDWQVPLPCEQECLAMDTDALIREVLIASADKVWMFARTVFPRSTLEGEYAQLAHLENRSLGSVLFKDPAMQRSEFEIAVVTPGTVWFEKVAQQLDLKTCETLWARRSLFDLKGKKLLLTEIFLPGMEKIL